MLLPAYGNVKIDSDEQHAVLGHALQIALRLTVGFSVFYCGPYQICHLNIKLKFTLNS